jgi:phosphohistidine phosphatase
MLVLDLIRHGHALAASAAGDAGRVLSPQGEAEIRGLAERLGAEGWRPDRALSSPYTRARQTLDLLLRELRDGPRPETLTELAPAGGVEHLLAGLEPALAGSAHAVLVGHMPLLGDLAHRLAGRSVGFTPGTLVRLSMADGLAGAARIQRIVNPAG